MDYGILGPVRVRRDGAETPLAGTKQRTVLAALLTAEDAGLTDAALSWFLWGESPPATATAQLYTQVSRLRRVLAPEGTLVRRARGYVVETGGAPVDVAEFRRLAARGRRALAGGRYPEAGSLLRAALALWRGPALGGVSEQLTAAEGPALEEARIGVLADRIEADLAADDLGRLLPELTRLVARHPLHERFRAQLMTALYRADRQAEALAVYDRGRRLLIGELGVEPGSLLRDVHRAVLAGERGLRPDGRPVPGVTHGPG